MWCDMCLSLTWLHLVWLSVGPYVFLPGVLFPSSWLSNILLWYMYLPVYVYICTLHLLKAIISSLSIGLLPCLHCFKKYCYEHWGAWIKVFPFLDIYPGGGFLHHMVVLFLLFQFSIVKVKVTQVVSDSLQPHRLYSPWNSPGQNTGMGSLSLLQGIFPVPGSNSGFPNCRQILYQLSHQGAQEHWRG